MCTLKGQVIIVIKNTLILIMVFILTCSIVNAVDLHLFSPGSGLNTYTFIDKSMWKDRHDVGDTVKHSLWAPHTPGDPYKDMDFNKDFWQPIQPWEYDVCRSGLSTQLNPKQNQLSIGGSIYNTTITVTANQFYAPENNSYLYEVSWYVHPFGETGGYYTINLMGIGIDDVFIQKTGAGQRRGSQGYNAFYSSKNYTKVKLVYEGAPYSFDILPTLDKNRLRSK